MTHTYAPIPPTLNILLDMDTAHQLLLQSKAPADPSLLEGLIQTLPPELLLNAPSWSSIKPWAKAMLARNARLDLPDPASWSSRSALPFSLNGLNGCGTFLALCSNPTASNKALLSVYEHALFNHPARVTPAMTAALMATGPDFSHFFLPNFVYESAGSCSHAVQAMICAYVAKTAPAPVDRFRWHADRLFSFVAPDLSNLLADPVVVNLIIERSANSDDLSASFWTPLDAVLSANPVHLPAQLRAFLLSRVPQLAQSLIKTLSTSPTLPVPLPQLPIIAARSTQNQPLPAPRSLSDLSAPHLCGALPQVHPRVAIHALTIGLNLKLISDQTAVNAMTHPDILAFLADNPAKYRMPWQIIDAMTHHFDLALTIPPNAALSPVLLMHLLGQTSVLPDTLPFTSHLLDQYAAHVAACSPSQLRAIGRMPYAISPLLANPLSLHISAATILRRVPPEFWGHLTITVPEPVRRAALRHWFKNNPTATIRALRKEEFPYSLDMLEKDPQKRKALLAEASKTDPDTLAPYPYHTPLSYY